MPSIKFEIESKTVSEFNRMRGHGDIVLQPEYQRKIVWSQAAQISLIETILLGFPIPEVYLSYETDVDGRSIASVVDGQQRLTALFNFIDNKFTLENLDKEEESLSGYEGKYFNDLDDDTKKEFWKYRFPIRRLSDLDEKEIRSVFARVNRVNVVLTSQEIKNALYPGQFLEFLKDCANHQITEKSGVFSGARRNRGGDLEFFAEVFGSCVFGIANKKTDFDSRYDELSKYFDDKYVYESEKFISILDFISNNINWSGRIRWSNIIDLYSLIIVVWNLWEQLNNSQLEGKFKESLNLFQQLVNEVKSSTGPEDKSVSPFGEINPEKAAELIKTYVEGIRSSSDLGSRRKRNYALKSWINNTLNLA